MKTICISDLDGTLLGRDGRISAFSCETLNQLLRQGLQFTYATARSYVSSAKALNGLTALDFPVIVYNGAAICDGRSGKVLSEVHFQGKDVLAVRKFLEARRIYPLVYSGLRGTERVRWLKGAENDGICNYLESRSGDRRLCAASSLDELYEGEIFYFTCIGPREELLPVYEHFRLESFCGCMLQQELYREEYFCELTPRNATKQEGVNQVRRMMGADQVIVFGDRINDLPLFKAADRCFAVENAADELKRAADEIIASNEEDGVARWILKHAKELV